MFKRKKAREQAATGGDAELDQAGVEESAAATGADEGDEASAQGVAGESQSGASGAFDRGAGPFDSSEVGDTSAYADFGAVLVPGVQGLSLRLEQDQASGQLVAMTIMFGAGAVQLRALAAPRTGGLWETHRAAMVEQVAKSGGRSTDAQGPFGLEVFAQVPVPEGQPGGPGLQAMRFVGVEGPRWMLYGAFFGEGADPATWEPLNGLFRQLVVVRGEEAMPVGSLLPLRAPAQPEPAATVQPQGPSLESLEPGDHITEVR